MVKQPDQFSPDWSERVVRAFQAEVVLARRQEPGGPRRHGRPARPAAPLTPRETETLTLLARGKTEGAIAGKFGVTKGTVADYAARARRKLGAADSDQAVAAAILSGLITP